MSARDDVLGNIRRALGVTGREAPRVTAAANRLRAHPRGTVPARGQKPDAERIDLFKTMATAALATVSEIATFRDAPAEIARYLRDGNLPATLRMGADSRLADLPWSDTALEVSAGRSHGADLNGVSVAFAGVAETGTLAMTSGADNPTTLNFLPDNHVVLVPASAIVGDYESVFDRLRARYGAMAMPRTLNFITGPSRSADIAQTMLLGAHGPRKLHIVVVRDA